jgi:hypothetical protein
LRVEVIQFSLEIFEVLWSVLFEFFSLYKHRCQRWPLCDEFVGIYEGLGRLFGVAVGGAAADTASAGAGP